jgi:hypothetical protein
MTKKDLFLFPIKFTHTKSRFYTQVINIVDKIPQKPISETD